MGFLCRDCLADAPAPEGRCAACGSHRTVSHPELDALSVAHVDCDAFYASVEKRDDPSLADKPVIVGGGKRGVALTCCYVARKYGVRSAMPMYRALKLCPDAVVVRPDMDKYESVAEDVRELMREVTPMVEPVSVDEAYLDLAGTEKLHRAPPARTLAMLASRIEEKIRITVSIGLGPNKYVAKVASDLGKPRGFQVIGRGDAVERLSVLSVTVLSGVGPVLARRLADEGITKIAQIQVIPEAELVERFGEIGARLARCGRGEDLREVTPDSDRKSLSSETTFEDDVADKDDLARILWKQAEKVSFRVKRAGIAGRCVTLKLKTADFKIRTRAVTLSHPTQLADTIFRAAMPALAREADGTRFRLLGVGLSQFADAAEADPPDLGEPDGARRAAVERAMDKLRDRFGGAAIVKGRRLDRPTGPR
jgi:DNA polymerase-4